jgi:hypothetical protein
LTGHHGSDVGVDGFIQQYRKILGDPGRNTQEEMGRKVK